MEDIDRASGVLFPFYDPDTEIVYIAGKGDANIRYFEITNEPPYVHYISTYQSQLSQRGLGYMPKRGCDINKNEIVRFFKLHATKIEPISFTVPRKSELFQPDIFPPTASNEPSLSCEDWWDGQNANPIPFDLSTLHTGGSGGNTSKFGGTSGGGGFGSSGGLSKFGAAKKSGGGGLSSRSNNTHSPVENMTKSQEEKKNTEDQERDQHAFDLRHKIQSGHVSSSPFMAQMTTASGMAVVKDSGSSTPVEKQSSFNTREPETREERRENSSLGMGDIKRASSVGQQEQPVMQQASGRG